MRLYLASTSPRRVDLLRGAGVAFVCVSPGDEPEGRGVPRDLAVQRATSKGAGALLAEHPPGWVLGVDTVVDLGGRELAKPTDAADARRMLLQLAGTTHEVHTAHALFPHPRDGRAPLLRTATARVQFAALSFEQVEGYVASGEWQGKAGGYAIQGLAGRFAKVVHGEFDTVVGLSVAAVRELLDLAAAASRGRGDGRGERA